ncbi:MAG: PilT/PilU family type 4a pilus ATPase [Deltaproteobacteria bacterium]|nr:PilT/PilU family type 4a pilus ATPase [Deltaproteobacteria bacterium]
MARTLKQLLTLAVERKASDLHLNVGVPPTLRIDGKLVSVDSTPCTPQETQTICFECLNQDQTSRLDNDRSIDLSFGLEGIARFRANIFWSLDNVAGAFRVVPYAIPTPEDLGLPATAVKLADKPRGLVLVTGPTGSGKTTTLAALIQHINQARAEHILTIEDPIELLYEQNKSIINQLEVGRDAKNFGQALKYTLRQDPNVVLIGEMRDFETIQSAITIAETGHLVFATLHTNTATQTIDRIIDVFPPNQQPQVRTQLSFILEGILCQQLLPKVGGGRSLALEILIPTPGIRNLIREGKTHQLVSQMQMGQQQSGMMTMDQALGLLVKRKQVEQQDALARCVNTEDFLKMVN